MAKVTTEVKTSCPVRDGVKLSSPLLAAAFGDFADGGFEITESVQIRDFSRKLVHNVTLENGSGTTVYAVMAEKVNKSTGNVRVVPLHLNVVGEVIVRKTIDRTFNNVKLAASAACGLESDGGESDDETEG